MLVEKFHDDDDNQDYYFAGCNEIQKPVMLKTAVTLRDETIIVEVSETPNVLKERMSKILHSKSVIASPKWLLEIK